ncbi:MAG: xanthine dehydrogenase family protein molybdopterin-binding subunit, partial [Chloroflexota bacterium]|nr:xanthine dehydrogenase family protein molybdopterin-binding subunit [Chloroflexota bacterium]
MAQTQYTVLGKSFPRAGGLERVAGAGIYGIDLAPVDALCGGILRSRHAHARIVSIDTAAAEALPGVHAVVTGADIPDVKYGMLPDRRILARDKVRYRGDPVAAVAAESQAILKQALNSIEVVYEPLPVLTDAEEAIEANAPPIHEEAKRPANLPEDALVSNVCAFTTVQVGDPDAAMAEADVVVEETYQTKMVH